MNAPSHCPVGVEFEVPLAWCRHPLVGEVHRLYVAQMRAAFSMLGLQVSERVAPHGRDFEARHTRNTLFSYHSVGRQAGVWRVKEGYLPYLFTVDREGYSGWLSGIRSQEFLEAFEDLDPITSQLRIGRLREKLNAGRISKYPQPTDIARSEIPDQPFVFFPLQMPGDTVIRLSRLDYYEAVCWAVHWAQVSRTPLVIKRHPLCEDERMTGLMTWCQEQPFVTLSTAPIHQLIGLSKAVLCCNSGVGFESLLQGKPVFTFGASDYAPATQTIQNLDELKLAFSDQARMDEGVVARFLCAYLDQCCMDVRQPAEVTDKVTRAIFDTLKT